MHEVSNLYMSYIILKNLMSCPNSPVHKRVDELPRWKFLCWWKKHCETTGHPLFVPQSADSSNSVVSWFGSDERMICRWKWTVWLQTSVPSWLMQLCRLDSWRSSELRNPWVRNLSWTWTKSNSVSQCQQVRTESNKVMCGRQGSPYMWAHGSWLLWCPATSHVAVKPVVSTRNGYQLPKVDWTSFQNLKWPQQ